MNRITIRPTSPPHERGLSAIAGQKVGTMNRTFKTGFGWLCRDFAPKLAVGPHEGCINLLGIISYVCLHMYGLKGLHRLPYGLLAKGKIGGLRGCQT